MTGRPLVISGAPRSGTTLLYNLFDGHSEISWLVTEAYFFEYLYDCGLENEAVYRRLASMDMDSLVDGLRDRQVIPPLHKSYDQLFAGTMEITVTYPIPWDEAKFRRELEKVEFGSIAALWRGLSKACLVAMGQPERKFVCSKSPDYGKSAVASLMTDTEARAIVILRDPVRAIDSLKYSREKRNEKRLTWPTLAIVIGNYVRMFEALRTSDSARLHVVRYEDLVSNPEAKMRDISRWLGVEFEACLTAPSFLSQKWTGHSTQRTTTDIDKDLATRPPKYLTEPELAVIVETLREPMRRFEYL